MVPGNLQGYGQRFVVSEDQKLDLADVISLVLRPNDSRAVFEKSSGWETLHPSDLSAFFKIQKKLTKFEEIQPKWRHWRNTQKKLKCSCIDRIIGHIRQ
jgi:hypothetical protein